MSKAKLKKYLQTLSKEQVIEVMLELYDARKEAKEYLEFYLTPDSNAELEGTHHHLNALPWLFHPICNYLIFRSFIHIITFYSVGQVFLLNAKVTNISE